MALAQLDLRRPERAPLATAARVRTRDDRGRIGSRCDALAKPRVVIVDDRPLTGQMLQAALRRHGIAADLTTIADEVEKRAGSGAAVTALVPVRAGEGAHTAAVMRRIIEAGGRMAPIGSTSPPASKRARPGSRAARHRCPTSSL